MLLLGVAEGDVRTDYLLTNVQLLPALKPLIDQMAAKGIDPELLTPTVGVQNEYFAARRIEHYYSVGAGLSARRLS